MVVLPTPTMLTVPTPPVVDTVATAGALLLYTKLPLLLLLGAVRSNAEAPKFFAGTDNAPIVGAARATVNVPLVELAA